MKVQLIHCSLNFTQNIPECLTVVGTCLKGTHFNINLLNTAQQVINLDTKYQTITTLINPYSSAKGFPIQPYIWHFIKKDSSMRWPKMLRLLEQLQHCISAIWIQIVIIINKEKLGRKGFKKINQNQ